jgi:hypothetical protein
MAQVIMSDAPSTTAVLLTVLPLVLLDGALDKRKKLPCHEWSHKDAIILPRLSGLTIGYACWIRQIDVVYLPALIAYLALVVTSHSKNDYRARIRCVVAAG